MLITKKVTILEKISDFANVFLKKSAKIRPKSMKIKKHAIKLEKNKQPLYRLIYNLGLIKLKTLKIYIKTNLINGFI